MKKYNSGIYVGKFFPFQKGHMKTLNTISNICGKVYLVFFYNEDNEYKLMEQLNYSIDERISDVKEIVKGTNIEVIKFSPSKHLIFPNDYLEIKKELFEKIGVDNIDIQIFGKDEENIYKDYIYANNYIVGDNIIVNGRKLHATLIREEYDKYKKFLHPIIRIKIDNKLNKNKYICITGKSGSGKSTLAKYLANNLEKSISIDIDKIAHEALCDKVIKQEIIELLGKNILDENNQIDRKKCGEIVFNNLKLKEQLYNITWKYMDGYIKNISTKNYNYIILDWYNINTKKYWDVSTLKIIVEKDYELRKKCILKRDNITAEYFDLREKNGNNYDDTDYDYIIKYEDKEQIDQIVNLLKR